MYMQIQKKLFTPVQIGPITLKHRIVMPPMSRLRAQWPSGIPSDLMREYYSQRASDGGLILTEATAISPSGRGYRGAPCLYRDEQVTGWKRITDAVHANGGYMFVQLWHAGRTTHVAVTGEQPVTASVDPAYWADPNIFVVTPDGFSRPSPHRALETTEIAVIIEQYRTAAVNAKRAGFDGVEVMAANGHLIDQFLQDNSNKRTDRYGGSVEDSVKEPTQRLLDEGATHEARTLGLALRLAYTLCAGSIELLAELGLDRSGNTLALDVPSESSLFVGETVQRRLDAVARSLGMNPVIRHRETGLAAGA